MSIYVTFNFKNWVSSLDWIEWSFLKGKKIFVSITKERDSILQLKKNLIKFNNNFETLVQNVQIIIKRLIWFQLVEFKM